MSLQRPADRLTVVSELYRYRVKPQAIATAVGCSRQTINDDIAALKRRGVLSRQLAEGSAFQRALQRFAELSVDLGTRTSWTVSRVYRALRSLLNIDAIINQLTGAAVAFERMRDPATDPRERGAADLIEYIFWTSRARGLPRRSSEQQPDAGAIAREYVTSFLVEVAAHRREIPSAIAVSTDLMALLMQEFLQSRRPVVRLPWPPESFQLIEAAIGLLPNERNREVIRLRFGLQDGRVRTLKEVGIALGGKHRERMRQREAQAMRQLRHPSRVKLLLPLAGTIGELVGEVVRRELSRHQSSPSADGQGGVPSNVNSLTK